MKCSSQATQLPVDLLDREPLAQRQTTGQAEVHQVDAGQAFRLTDSGRYAHAEAHVRAVAAAAGLEVERLTEGLLRYEYGAQVRGLVTTLRRR